RPSPVLAPGMYPSGITHRNAPMAFSFPLSRDSRDVRDGPVLTLRLRCDSFIAAGRSPLERSLTAAANASRRCIIRATARVLHVDDPVRPTLKAGHGLH